MCRDYSLSSNLSSPMHNKTLSTFDETIKAVVINTRSNKHLFAMTRAEYAPIFT